MSLVLALLSLAQAQEVSEESAPPSDYDIEGFEEMEEDGVGRLRGVASTHVEFSGYTALNLHVVHDAAAIVTTAGFSPDTSGVVVEVRPARPVLGHLHASWSPTAGFAMPEAYAELAFWRRRVQLRAGRWLTPIGLYNTERYAAVSRIVPELPIASEVFFGVPASSDGLALSSGMDFGSNNRLDGELWLINSPRADGDAGLVPAPYEGAAAPLSAGARLGVTIDERLSAGVAGQRGAVPGDPLLKLSLAGFYATYSGERLRVDGEWLTHQLRYMADFGPLKVTTSGLTLAAGYAVVPRVEPVAQLEWVRLSPESVVGGVRLTGGVNVVPFPERWPDAHVGVAYAHHIDALGYWRDSRAIGQVALGF